MSVATGVAELRNRGYGTGRGATGARVGLHTRHAHLAVNAAITWCQLMLDTPRRPTHPGARAAHVQTLSITLIFRMSAGRARGPQRVGTAREATP
jgi:hypothetical protein